MLYYIASQAYLNVIAQACEETDQIITGSECGEEIYLALLVKEKQFATAETIIVDLYGIKDTEDEICAALDQIRLINSDAKIIILAPGMPEGSEILSRCFSLSIYDIINSQDYMEIKDSLIHSITVGKQYRDSVVFKDVIDFEALRNQPKVVDHVRIGVIGTQHRIGTTHHAIVLATTLRQMGFMVAINSVNNDGVFSKLAESYEYKSKNPEVVYHYRGIDYYVAAEDYQLEERAYNFIIYDFGCQDESDMIRYLNMNQKIVISGVKPWEDYFLNEFFGRCDAAVLNDIIYCFNFCPADLRRDVKAGMAELSKRTYFLDYQEDPLECVGVPYDEILKEAYVSENLTSEKKKRRKGK